MDRYFPKLLIVLKGFAMGMADIVPGVSGGTIALVTGIYDDLIRAISSVDKTFFGHVFQFKIKAALNHININFLLPLMVGILTAVISMSRLMHYFMSDFPIYTWSLFFGLILASIFYVGRTINNWKRARHLAGIMFGTIIGFAVVSLIPVQTPETMLFIFLSGFIAIIAMILPGISGSFILLILGKYLFVTSALKDPTSIASLEIIVVFAFGCLLGLLSFSKILNFLLQHFHNLTMSVLTGFMIGSLKKIWPWKEVLETKLVRGKTHVIRDLNVLPAELNQETIFALLLMILGIILVLILENLGKKS